jgi:prefoldin subunit 5
VTIIVTFVKNERDTLQNQLQRLQQEVTSLRMIICNNTNTSENSNLKNDGENETEMEKMSSTEISLQKQLQNMLQEIERLHQENAVLRQQQQQSQSPSQYTPRVHSHQISLKDK